MPAGATLHSVPVRHRDADPLHPGDAVIYVGVAVFLLGVVAVVAEFAPFFFGHSNQPLWLAFATLLVPVGLGLALGGLFVQARAARLRAGEHETGGTGQEAAPDARPAAGG